MFKVQSKILILSKSSLNILPTAEFPPDKSWQVNKISIELFSHSVIKYQVDWTLISEFPN